MKKIFTFLAVFLLHHFCTAQIFKSLGQKAKEEVEYRVRRKAGQKIDQGLDSILAQPKKIVEKDKAKKNGGDQPKKDQDIAASTEKQKNKKDSSRIN